MIKKIRFKNYKAFTEGEINIKPITILLGANSVGKSSIVQLLLMLQQTALSDKYKSALKLHGEFVSLGENENIFHNKNTANNLELSFTFSDNELMKSFKGSYLERLTDSLIGPINMLSEIAMYHKKEKENNDNLADNRILNPLENIFLTTNRKQRKKAWSSKENFLAIVKSIIELQHLLPNIKNEELVYFKFLDNYLSEFNKSQENESNNEIIDNYSNMYDFLKELSKINSDEFELSFIIKNIKNENKDILKVEKIILKSDSINLLELKLGINTQKNHYSEAELKTDLIDINKPFSNLIINNLLDSINYEATIFNIFNKQDIRESFYLSLDSKKRNSSIIANIILHIFASTTDNLKNIFGKELINYVSPLRAHPKRYYFLDKAKINTVLDTLDGDSLTEILKENRTLQNKVNDWLKNFGLEVSVYTLEDVIHKLRVNQNDLTLDITDVGFGLSQVLPVIVQGFLSLENSLTIIEQPEIHLHPKMQADLADLFIDIVMSMKKKKPFKFLIIETHSEYLLKRLRRRMAEKESITAKNVAIYFFNPKCSDNDAKIEQKIIDNDGAFEWPQNFYSGELLKDTVEFIKNQRY